MSDNKKAKVAWICGAYYLSKAMLDKVRAIAAGVEYFDCYENTEFGKLMTFLTSRSCFSENRIAVIHALPKMSDSEKKKFREVIEDVPEGVLLVFFMIEPSEERAIYNSVQKIGDSARTYQYPAFVPKSEAKGWVMKRAKEIGIQVEEDAAIAIAENSGIENAKDENGKSVPSVNVDIMENAIQRLVLAEPGKKIYTKEDAILSSVYYSNFVIWDLMNSCEDKDFEECINSFNKYAADAGAIPALNEIVNVLAWKYRMLFSLKEGIANNLPMDKSVIRTSSIRKVALVGSGRNAVTKTNFIESGQDMGKPVPIWNQRACMNAVNSFYGKKPQIENYSRKELFLIVKCIEDSMYLARTCKSDSEACLIADIIFMTICSLIDSKTINSIKKSLDKQREQI